MQFTLSNFAIESFFIIQIQYLLQNIEAILNFPKLVYVLDYVQNFQVYVQNEIYKPR